MIFCSICNMGPKCKLKLIKGFSLFSPSSIWNQFRWVFIKRIEEISKVGEKIQLRFNMAKNFRRKKSLNIMMAAVF